MNTPKTGKSRPETTLRIQVRDLKRERVLGEATKLFYERGFQASSIGAIAERLSVTKPFIYSYFDNKHALLVALYERAISDLNAGVDKIFSVDHAPDEQLKLLVKFYVSQNIESRELTTIFLNEERNLSPEILAEIRKKHREFDRKLTDLIRRGIKTGVFHVADAGLASLSISGMVRWVHRWYDPTGRLNTDDICESIATLALNLVCYKPAPAAPVRCKTPAEPVRERRPATARNKKVATRAKR
jgi:AcrR family transcriptional regulator